MYYVQITIGDVFGLRLDFTLHSEQYILTTLYRTHYSNVDLFLSELEEFFNYLPLNVKMIFVGDINIDLLKGNHISDRYLNCLIGNGLVQCIDKPTRVSYNSMSCLDHIFVRIADLKYINTAIFETGITDHYGTALNLTVTTNNNQQQNKSHLH